jgi:hypothetical protein
MDISILGYKINLEVLILIGIVYLIFIGHTFCGCCNFGMMEGMENAKSTDVVLPTQVSSGGVDPVSSSTLPSNGSKKGTNASAGQEAFVGANTNYGQSSPYDLNNDRPIDTSSWSAQNMVVVPGQPVSEGVKKFLARPQQKLPLPEGELDFFANTKFAPEYCPNTYSNSSGCAAMTGEQYNYLITRGGNNVPYSEY